MTPPMSTNPSPKHRTSKLSEPQPKKRMKTTSISEILSDSAIPNIYLVKGKVVDHIPVKIHDFIRPHCYDCKEE
jgi:hypothetical protein